MAPLGHLARVGLTPRETRETSTNSKSSRFLFVIIPRLGNPICCVREDARQPPSPTPLHPPHPPQLQAFLPRTELPGTRPSCPIRSENHAQERRERHALSGSGPTCPDRIPCSDRRRDPPWRTSQGSYPSRLVGNLSRRGGEGTIEDGLPLRSRTTFVRACPPTSTAHGVHAQPPRCPRQRDMSHVEEASRIRRGPHPKTPVQEQLLGCPRPL